MATKNSPELHALSELEIRSLVELVREQRGDALGRADFAEIAHELFEDIPGFESNRPDHANRLVRQLWSKLPNSE